MKIAEIFYSIQGEGMLAGVPSVFMRTSGCNLRCTWCDTPYTSWNPGGSTSISIDGILSRGARAFGATHVVVTGGEPMMFDEIVELTERLKDWTAHHDRNRGHGLSAGEVRPDEHQSEARQFHAAGIARAGDGRRSTIGCGISPRC